MEKRLSDFLTTSGTLPGSPLSGALEFYDQGNNQYLQILASDGFYIKVLDSRRRELGTFQFDVNTLQIGQLAIASTPAGDLVVNNRPVGFPTSLDVSATDLTISLSNGTILSADLSSLQDFVLNAALDAGAPANAALGTPKVIAPVTPHHSLLEAVELLQAQVTNSAYVSSPNPNDAQNTSFLITSTGASNQLVNSPTASMVSGGVSNKVDGGSANTIVASATCTITGGSVNSIIGSSGCTITSGNYTTIISSGNCQLAGTRNAMEGCYGCSIPASCSGVRLLECSNFSAPANSSGALYIRGKLVMTDYATPTAVRSAVTGGTFSSGELQGTQPAGSLANMKFTDAAYRYEYTTSAADTNGTKFVWTRTAKA